MATNGTTPDLEDLAEDLDEESLKIRRLIWRTDALIRMKEKATILLDAVLAECALFPNAHRRSARKLTVRLDHKHPRAI